MFAREKFRLSPQNSRSWQIGRENNAKTIPRGKALGRENGNPWISWFSMAFGWRFLDGNVRASCGIQNETWNDSCTMQIEKKILSLVIGKVVSDTGAKTRIESSFWMISISFGKCWNSSSLYRPKQFYHWFVWDYDDIITMLHNTYTNNLQLHELEISRIIIFMRKPSFATNVLC